MARRLLLWLGAFIAILAGMAASGGEARQYIVAIGAICLLRPLCALLRRAASLHTSACEAGAICCSALFVLVPWDAARLQVLLKMSRAERAVGPSAEEKDNSARS